VKRGRWLVVAVALTVAVAGCSALSTVLHTQDALNDAGYKSAHVSSTFSGDVSTVKASVTVDSVPTVSDADNVAHVVWKSFHERFDHLHVTVHGSGPSAEQQYTFDQLQSMFGARNPAWNRTTVRSAYRAVGVEIVIGLVVLALLVVLIVVLATRGRRRKRAMAWPYGGPGPPYGGPPSPPFGRPPGPPYGGPPGWISPAPTSAGQGAGGYPMWQPPPHPPRDPSKEPPPP
jgi:hypothetical protein